MESAKSVIVCLVLVHLLRKIDVKQQFCVHLPIVIICAAGDWNVGDFSAGHAVSLRQNLQRQVCRVIVQGQNVFAACYWLVGLSISVIQRPLWVHILCHSCVTNYRDTSTVALVEMGVETVAVSGLMCSFHYFLAQLSRVFFDVVNPLL